MVPPKIVPSLSSSGVLVILALARAILALKFLRCDEASQ